MHTPTPWHTRGSFDGSGDIGIVAGNGHDTELVAEAYRMVSRMNENAPVDDNAAFIVQACNAHDALVAALTEAIDLIRIWHGIQNGAGAWNIYAEHSPEMKRLYAALALATPKEAVR